MRCVNMDQYKILVQGQEWDRDTAPCSREASQVLENNEAFVTWLAPRDALGAFAQHIPAIRYQGKYWTISLRMSKSIYRSVRLRKGFYNMQTVHGVQTLRIPQLLFNEKQRTQARFKVTRTPAASAARAACARMRVKKTCARVLKYIYYRAKQEMNAKSKSDHRTKPRKGGNSNVLMRSKSRCVHARACACQCAVRVLRLCLHVMTHGRDYRHSTNYTNAILQMLHEAQKTVEALDSGERILPRCMHSDIHEFVGQVCRELCMLYPVASTDPASVLRIFKQHLEHKKDKPVKTQASPVAYAETPAASAAP